MTELATVFGNALYELSCEENCAEEMMQQLGVIVSAIKENPDFAKVLSAPGISHEEKDTIVDTCFKGKVSQNLLNFLKLASQRGIAAQLGTSFAQFKNRYNEDNGIVTVTAISANPLTDALQQALLTKLSSMFSGKKVQLATTVDPTLMGGMRLEMDGRLIDGSVKAKLESLKNKILATTA
ncbi:MAG: ATP synthase F1 subunit delta [Oscillospiraceae bacterium]|nr:ATP synthase F1 subunit delta [Oscillospiraceae bacterium]